MRPSLLLSLLIACKGGSDSDTDPSAPEVGEGLFAEGCPGSGRSVARAIGIDASLPGDLAVGTRGDLLIANGRAAFVITEPEKGATYYYYGGVVADAVAMDGCAPTGDDGLDEVGLVAGSLDLGDFESSVLRAFRGERAEVIADGSDGGPAIVRISGVDDRQWLVEYELIRGKADDGGRPLSEPFGIEWTMDYILEPDSPVLRLEWTMRNVGDKDLSLLTAALLSFGPTYDLHAYASASLSVGSLNLGTRVPWIVSSDGSGAYAYAPERGNLAYTGIAGIEIALDVDQALSTPIAIGPGEEETRVSFLSVGPTDGPTASAPLAAVNPEPIRGQTWTPRALSGVARDEAGAPLPGARIALEGDAPGESSGFGTLDEAWADAAGRFTLSVPDFTDPWDFRLVSRAPGRDPSAPVPIGASDTETDVPTGPAGSVALSLTEGGSPVPARVALVRGADGRRLDLWSHGSGTEPVPPGTWAYTVTRGFEYAPVTGSVTIPAGGSGSIDADLVRVVDTAGWRSLDTHVHSDPSPDSRAISEVQLLHGAAHGLEAAVFSEHENIVTPPAPGDLAPFIATIGGQEVTATVPEHMTMFPVTPDGSARGGFIEWYGNDIATLFGQMRDRSPGGISIFNHPGYMDLIGWDPVLAEPTLDDPTLLGLASDAALWDWNFDGMEVMNGFGSPFANGNGRFQKWQSLLNAGHIVAPIGCSDDHGGDETGFPRTYYAAAADDTFDLDEVTASVRGGAVIVSAGAFARVGLLGAGPGDLVDLTVGGAELEIHVEAIPAVDVTRVVVFANCEPIADLAATDPDGVVKFDERLALSSDGTDAQIVVAAFGENRLPLGMPQFDPAGVPRVLTGAILVDGDGDGEWTAPGGRVCGFVP